MVDPTPIGGDPRGSFLASVDLYRMPDGTVRLELRDMAASQIESMTHVRQRFFRLAAWLIEGSSSALDQGTAFDEGPDASG